MVGGGGVGGGGSEVNSLISDKTVLPKRKHTYSYKRFYIFFKAFIFFNYLKADDKISVSKFSKMSSSSYMILNI